MADRSPTNGRTAKRSVCVSVCVCPCVCVCARVCVCVSVWPAQTTIMAEGSHVTRADVVSRQRLLDGPPGPTPPPPHHPLTTHSPAAHHPRGRTSNELGRLRWRRSREREREKKTLDLRET